MIVVNPVVEAVTRRIVERSLPTRAACLAPIERQRGACGVPGMCDGVARRQARMDLSLFSRDTIALSFGDAGGTGYVLRGLLGAGLMHRDATTVARESLADYAVEPVLVDGALQWTVEAPEAARGGALALLRDGDIDRVDADEGVLTTRADVSRRIAAPPPPAARGTGRELFAFMRYGANGAEQGASAMLAAAGL